jgi:hypothetical protein
VGKIKNKGEFMAEREPMEIFEKAAIEGLTSFVDSVSLVHNVTKGIVGRLNGTPEQPGPVRDAVTRHIGHPIYSRIAKAINIL